MVVGRNYHPAKVRKEFNCSPVSSVFQKRIDKTILIRHLASQCPPLPETLHANATILNGVGRNYGTIIRYECEPGFIRNGFPVVLCMSNGTWSSATPTCIRKFGKLSSYDKSF